MIRIVIAALSSLPGVVCAQGVNLAGVPQNCEAPMARDMEMANIPAILELGPDAAHIVSIKTETNRNAYQYYPGLYRLDCLLTVQWSNGQLDRFYKFSTWENKYGQTMVSYGR